jgi:hypothetical protein
MCGDCFARSAVLVKTGFVLLRGGRSLAKSNPFFRHREEDRVRRSDLVACVEIASPRSAVLAMTCFVFLRDGRSHAK